jgi:HEAT repeat protein
MLWLAAPPLGPGGDVVDSVELITVGALVTAALWAVLVVFVVLRKSRRDARERRALVRRGQFWDAVEQRDHAALETVAAEAIGSEPAQVDLLIMLDGKKALDAEAREAVRKAFEDSGLADSLVKQARGRDAVRRGTAALLLGRARLAVAVDVAVPLLGDDDLDVRLTACAALADAHSAEAARALVEAIGDSGIPAPRLIERLAAGWAAPVALQALEGGEERTRVRVALIRALGLAGYPEAVPALLVSLHGADEEERISAARSLGQIAGGATAPALLAALDDPSWRVRAQAAKSLGLIGAEAAVPALTLAMSDAAWWVRANAGNALRTRGPRGIAALEEIAGTSPDDYARDRARESLALAAAGIGPGAGGA